MTNVHIDTQYAQIRDDCVLKYRNLLVSGPDYCRAVFIKLMELKRTSEVWEFIAANISVWSLFDMGAALYNSLAADGWSSLLLDTVLTGFRTTPP